jgi:hypothetical protein
MPAKVIISCATTLFIRERMMPETTTSTHPGRNQHPTVQRAALDR